MNQTDIVIVGGGPVGALAAVVLGQHYRVTLLEQRQEQMWANQPRSRTLALNYQSLNILQQLALLPHLRPYLTPIKQVHVSVKGHIGTTRIKASDHGLAALGGVIEQHQLEQVLYQRLQAIGAHVVCEADFKDMNLTESGWQVIYLKGGRQEQLTADFCIGCDGQYSKVRQAMGIDIQSKDYHQTAIVTLCSLKRAHHGTAYEHFCDHSTVAMLPMYQQQATCIWTVPTIDGLALNRLSFDNLSQQMCQAFKRLETFAPTITFKASFNLKAMVSHTQTTKRGLLLGNAAHSLHPIAAQGFNLSLRDLWSLRKVLQQHGSLKNLSDSYLSMRARDQGDMLQYTNLMASQAQSLPSWVKSFGLSLIDLIPGVANKLTRFNLGVYDEAV